MPPADPNARTFSLQPPADLFRKMQFEAGALRQAPPDDLTQRAYAVMNAVTSAWQMKECVYLGATAAGFGADHRRRNELAGWKLEQAIQDSVFQDGTTRNVPGEIVATGAMDRLPVDIGDLIETDLLVRVSLHESDHRR